MAVPAEQSLYFASKLQHGDLVVRDAPKFDLESYISNYEGHTRLARLNWIARHCPPLSLDALRIGINEAKAGKDAEAYLALTGLLHEIESSNELAVPDMAWIERKKKENDRETERLEHELRGYKNNLIKESIRMGQEDLATHYLSMSAFEQSSKTFQKMREYCTTPKHIAELWVKLIYAHSMALQWITVQSNCHRARVLSLKPEDKERFDPVVEACSGLAYMGAGDYRGAASAFLKVNPAFVTEGAVAGINFAKAVLTGNDIAVYGGLSALVAMDRDELRSAVLDNSHFRNFLELEPHIRRAITFFCDGKYSQCLATLEAYRNDYLLDIFLGPHVTDLYQRIRTKSIVQYFVPFSKVTLSALATAFPRPGSHTASTELIEEELVHMIQSGLLHARIDTVDKLLVAPPQDARAEAHKAVLETAQEVEHTLRLKLNRMNMVMAGLEIEGPKGKGKGIKGGGMSLSSWESGNTGFAEA